MLTSRYNECKDKILPYLKKLGFNPAKDLSFLPVSGQTGQGLLEQVNNGLLTYISLHFCIYLYEEMCVGQLLILSLAIGYICLTVTIAYKSLCISHISHFTTPSLYLEGSQG